MGFFMLVAIKVQMTSSLQIDNVFVGFIPAQLRSA
jgi:hypothetical protein